jgi:mRNA interferase RelE/StbE
MEIRFSRTALKALRKSDKAALIRAKIGELAADPDSLANNVTPLTGRPESRLRVQNWRVIFRVEDDVLWIDDIGPRGSVY